MSSGIQSEELQVETSDRQKVYVMKVPIPLPLHDKIRVEAARCELSMKRWIVWRLNEDLRDTV
jgi:hypothetical protein